MTRTIAPRITIDAHAIGSNLGGNETYMRGLLGGLHSIGVASEIRVLANDDAVESLRADFPEFRYTAYRSRSSVFRLLVDLPLFMDGRQLLHVQYVAPPLHRYRVIATIHDLSFEHRPEYFTARQALLYRAAIRRTARKAERILTVSDYSKRDLVAKYGLSSDRVTVTYNGVTESFSPAPAARIRDVLARYGITRPFVLAVGNVHPRKNLPRLVQAFRALPSSLAAQYQLVAVGKQAWLADESIAHLRSLVKEGRAIMTGYVDADDLPALYSAATAFVYPSLFEGFGLPPVEAMACGCPTIVSRSTSLPEICGNAALYVNPFDVVDITQQLQQVLSSPAVRDDLHDRGIARAAYFRWDATARRTWDAYCAALEC